MPKNSIIMPVYNGERYLRHAMDSVLGQSAGDLELLVVNDGSTDSTADLLEEVVRQDSRVRVFTLPNSGGAAIPKNYALDRACGDYIGFLDHDDYWAPDRLRDMTEGLDRHPDWIAAFHDVCVVRADGTPIGISRVSHSKFLQTSAGSIKRFDDGWYDCGERFYAFMATRHHLIHTGSIMIARKRVDYSSIRFDIQYRRAADIDLWFRIALMGRIGYLDRVLSYYRRHESNITNDNILLFNYEVKVLAANYERMHALFSGAEATEYRARMATVWHDLAHQYSIAYRLSEARTAYQQALRLHPCGRYRYGLLKACLPAAILRVLRTMRHGDHAR